MVSDKDAWVHDVTAGISYDEGLVATFRKPLLLAGAPPPPPPHPRPPPPPTPPERETRVEDGGKGLVRCIDEG